MDSKITFGSFLKMLRERIKFSPTQTAKVLGVSTAYYLDIEKGNRGPLRAEKLYPFCTAMGFDDETRMELIAVAKHGILERYGY